MHFSGDGFSSVGGDGCSGSGVNGNGWLSGGGLAPFFFRVRRNILRKLERLPAELDVFVEICEPLSELPVFLTEKRGEPFLDRLILPNLDDDDDDDDCSLISLENIVDNQTNSRLWLLLFDLLHRISCASAEYRCGTGTCTVGTSTSLS